MRVSARADYAVRAAVELAARPGLWTKAEAIADAQRLPLPFLLQTLKQLRVEGVVAAKRGAEGGYRLTRPASEVTVADLVRAVDGPLASVAGTLVEDLEYDGNAAALRDTWVALRCAIRSVLVGVTLADLLGGELPPLVGQLLAGDDAWTTDPGVRRRFEARREPGVG
ncbi:MAG: Rrf2 family transcriptional regulator [Mycobacteriales bacterium]|nr:Rrf2 family transcriptional regulator [Mycobacteriales bacterium]